MRQKPVPAKPGKSKMRSARRASLGRESSAEEKAHWTFLTNHSHVLILLYQDSSMVLREVAARIGITERAVQRIIAELEEGGFIERERVGRQNHYRTLTRSPLRHPIEAHRTIGDLLNLISVDSNSRKSNER